MEGKAFRVARISCQPIEAFYVHAATPRAFNSPALEFQIDLPTRKAEISHLAKPFIVTAATGMTTVGTNCCFFRRRKLMIRTRGSPNTPFRLAFAAKPEKEKSSRRLRAVFTHFPRQTSVTDLLASI
jgi:hypothetical protein